MLDEVQLQQIKLLCEGRRKGITRFFEEEEGDLNTNGMVEMRGWSVQRVQPD